MNANVEEGTVSNQESASDLLRDPHYNAFRIGEAMDGLTDEGHVVLRALSFERRAISAGEWITRVQGFTQDVLRVEAFIAARDSLMAELLVVEEPPHSGQYSATALGRGVTLTFLVEVSGRRGANRGRGLVD